MVSSLCLSGKTQKKSLAEGRHICDLKVRFFHGEVQVLVKSRLGIGAFKTIEKVAHLAGPFLPHQPGPIYAYAKIIERKELRQELKKIEAELSEATASTATLTQIAELRQEKAELRAEIESVQNALHEEAAISKEFPNSDIVRMWTVTNQKDPSSIKGVMMELCDCGDISTFVDALSFPLSPDAMRRNVRLAFHIAKALADIHAQGRGRCHMDIKPGNILLKYENGKIVPKLTDFGLSKCTGAFLKQPCGTPAYIAPELYGNAKTAQPSMDAWSFGIICTELFYGLSANPFLQNDEVLSAAQDFFNHARYRRNKALWEHLGEEIKASVRQYPAIDTVIRHLLDLNPLTRWTAQKAADAFSQLLNKLG